MVLITYNTDDKIFNKPNSENMTRQFIKLDGVAPLMTDPPMTNFTSFKKTTTTKTKKQDT